MEPEHHRIGQPLIIKNWWWEASYEKCSLKIKKEIKAAVTKGLENFAAYLDADGVDKKNLPPDIRP